MLKIALIRHGKTAGNIRRAYIGRTDEPLCERDLEPLRSDYPRADLVFSSPLLRCRETARILYPELPADICEGLRECDFGDFEGKNYEELRNEKSYKAWLDCGGETAFPGGESGADFRERCVEAFVAIVRRSQGAGTVAIICHGGTIMAILERFSCPQKDFYHWQPDNLCGYVFDFDDAAGLAVNIQKLGEKGGASAWK